MVGITSSEIDTSAPMRSSSAALAGSVVTYVGRVRAEEGATGLSIEADVEQATKSLKSIREEAVRRFGLSCADVVHRIGEVTVGDVVLLVAAGAPERDVAFEACTYIVEAVKEQNIIRKRALLAA
ncbi:MAG: molybdenum cofactor biosynthesis protein MoaE [Methanofollis sp.]|uniref:molybdenum cofactor biosynthesis protein MoaE n=1 Tax=Methanofollis sp. TaxID=2052835 RepID=UPI00261CC4D6|nr:molybdenum cofactor biosynthesis protein MoaE [Methanofollis sp.]MDD4253820.1 molybdenum cofactor biosynthesis protein MoaE [Methanofollis sp.]